MYIKYIISSALLICLLGGCAVRAEEGPLELLERLSARLLEIVREEPGVVGDKNRLRAITDDIVLPHIDFETLSRWVLGKHWRSASTQQRERFMEQYRELLRTVYLQALAGYKNQTIHFLPLPKVQEGGDVVVSAQVEQQGGAPPVPVQFRMHQKQGRWMIFDVIVEGVSLVATYRTSFSEEIRQHGMDGLLARLEERNSKGNGPGTASQPAPLDPHK
jgi:phospholipid transport system substrate-binding protein